MEARILQLLVLLLLFAVAAQHAPVIAIPSPRCQTQCGGVEIPYPFGVGLDCSLALDFNISCKVRDGISKPILWDNTELLDISLIDGTIRFLNPISTSCYNRSSDKMEGSSWRFNLRDSPYLFSDVHNKFTVIGCNTLAYIANDNKGDLGYQSGCVSTCRNLSDLADGCCTGIGCCQTAIPKEMDRYYSGFDMGFNTSQIWNFSRCSYAVLVEAEAFNFSTAYITTTEFNDTNSGQVPVVIDWAIRNGSMSCEVAKQNKEGTYAYLCNCSKGYEGNPYLPDGCHGNNYAKNTAAYLYNVQSLNSAFIILSSWSSYCRC